MKGKLGVLFGFFLVGLGLDLGCPWPSRYTEGIIFSLTSRANQRRFAPPLYEPLQV
jgi:hypothetical protein